MNAYQLIQQDQLQEFKSGGSLYRHTKSGAQIYHMANQDNENSFAFSFHTPPPDDSGVPHILEHTVLCGSESFPIKDPFITLYKGSMHTFLNAFTAPEFTVYPASTVVEKDFFNLMRIYGDAVFFPLLRREAFMQEGHHVGLDEQGKAQRVGIVYNEMKGSYSSHESLLVEHSFRALFPGDPLSRDSGGDPGYIPDLTYEQFVDFHKKHYHPSNCRIFLYGDIPVQKSLDFLDKHFLSRFESAEPPLPNREIIPWNKPEIMEFPAPKGESDGCSHSVNWLLSPAWQPEERVALQVLAQILMGHGGSPLQMAIQQSPLGEDLSPVSGLELDVGHILFTLGIRGSARENAQAFKELVFNELQKLCDHGISDEQINGALGLVEFREREIRGGTPLGLRLMGRLSRSWNYGENPILGLSFEKPFARLKKQAQDQAFWAALIKKHFLDNPHHSLVTLYPQEDYQQKQREKEEQAVNQWVSNLDDKARENWEISLVDLKTFQQEEDDPEILKSIPFLTKEEIPKEVSKIPFEKFQKLGFQWYEQNLYTRGVNYLDLGFSLDDFNLEERLWLPLFSHCFNELGTENYSYDQLAQQIALDMGGIHSSLVSGTPLGHKGGRNHFVIRMKMLKEQISPSLELLREILFKRDYNQETRLKELLLEFRNDIRTSLIPNGSGYALTRAAAPLSQGTLMDEFWYGISQYQHIQGALEQWENHGSETLIREFQSLSQKIFVRLKWVSLCSEGSNLSYLQHEVEDELRTWVIEPVGESQHIQVDFPAIQALQVPATVSFTAGVTRAAALDSPSYACELVISQLLKAGYLWENIRMKGGAYGASAGASGLEGYYFFSSFRDPRGHLSYKDYRSGLEYLKKNVTQMDIDLALIGLVGKDLAPLSPAQKASMAVKRDLYFISDELRQKNRDRLLSLTVEDLQSALDDLLNRWDSQQRLVLLAGKEHIEAALVDYPDFHKHSLELQV